MPRINLKSTNSKISLMVFFMIILYGIISFILPLLIINLIPQSTLGNYFIEHIFILTFFYLLISIYFIIVGCFYYYIKIDAYVMHIESYRIFYGLLNIKNYIEVPHDMLIQYAFFNRPLTFNKTLMLKIRDADGKKIVKRFNISFLSKIEERRISKVFEQIIAKNS